MKGIVGIQNVGNTCYCNSTIQLIRSCQEWSAFCITTDFTGLKESVYKNVLMAYQDIIKSLWSASTPAYVRPLGFINEIKKAVQGTVYEMFGFPIPNDSHEFLIYLLDNFHEAMKTEIPYIENTSKEMTDMAQNGWNKFVSKNNSEVVHRFFGMMRKTICCTNCKNSTYQWEVFNSLKIPCEGTTFKEWILNEVKEIEIGDYKCNKCNEKYAAKIYTHIWKLPKNLFITIRRFNPNGSKNMTHCPYGGEDITFSEFFAPESNDPSKSWIYELTGISDHHGTHMGGHYNTQFKYLGEWWKIDDETATQQSPQFTSNYIFLFKYTLEKLHCM